VLSQGAVVFDSGNEDQVNEIGRPVHRGRKIVRTTRTLFTLAVVLAFIATFTGFSFAQARITQQIDESQVAVLSGNTRPEAKNQAYDRGAVSDSFDADHMFLLLQRSPAQERKLNKFIDQLNDKNSPNFHKWLTAEEFGQKFGVAQEDIDKVTGWLQYHGFRVNQVYANRMVIDFGGTAGQLREAFHTSIHNLAVNGEQHFANMNDPQIPAALASVVKGISSLHDFKPRPMYKARPDYTFAGCASSSSAPTEPGTCYAVTPQDDAVIYNLSPLWSAGYTGTGQTIAVVEDTDTYGGSADWTSFVNTFGLSSYGGTYSQVHPGCTDPGTNADDGEAAIDVEMATAFAPGAAVKLISCGGGTFTFGGLIALTNLVNAAGPYPGIVSISYGSCEASTGNGGNYSFYSTYQQAASEGISVFVSSGDDGPVGCSADFTNGSEYDLASLAVTGWGETPYNVSVGGTDFEDVYNAKFANPVITPLSTYWNSTNSASYESAKSYIPEIPWNDSCASALISEYVRGSFTTYGSTGTCNVSPWNTSTSYLSVGAAAGGASNCATGQGGSLQGSNLISAPECQGWPKPSWQSGATLTGGKAVYGVPNDGVRDIPDVSLFAANGDWGHFQTVCWSDPAYTSDGAATCTAGSPNAWSGFGGTSVATPAMAGIQALVNQKTGATWGNPNPIYYQIAQNQYGISGGTFLGSSCNSSGSGGPASSCVFNDVTQGDINVTCEYNGTGEEAHCYKPSGTYGVASTDVVTAATVIWGGTGYTTAPTCTIAGPTNANPYKSPTGTTLYAGGTQATCTAAVTATSTTAVWTVTPSSSYYTYDAGLIITVGSQNYTMSGSTRATLVANLCTAINANNTVATCTASSTVATITAKVAGAAGNFQVNYASITGGPALNEPLVLTITNTVKGQGPNYVSGITITGAGSGYQPETPITFGGPGTGALAVANTSPGTAASTYQPAYGAAPGYDMATGLGTVNAYNLVNNCVWLNTCTTTAVSSSQNPSTAGTAVTFTATVTGNSPTGTVQFVIDGSNFGSPVTLSGGTATSGSISSLTVGTHTVTATYSGDTNNSGSTGTLSGGQVVTKATSATAVSSSLNPSVYGQAVNFTANVTGFGTPTGTVQFVVDGSSFGSPVTLVSGSATSNNTSTLAVGTHTVTANYSGDSNNLTSSGSLSPVQTVTSATAGVGVACTPNPSNYTQSVTCTATISGQFGLVRSKKPMIVTGTVTWSANTGCGTTAVTSGTPGTATCTTSVLPIGTDTVEADYSGDANHQPGSGTTSEVVNPAATSTVVLSSLNPSTYGQAVSFSATVTGATPTGTVAFSIDGNPPFDTETLVSGAATSASISTLAVGTHTVTATYSGDSNNSGSTGTLAGGQVVGAASTTTSVVGSPNPSVYATSVTFTATINAANNLVKGRKQSSKKPLDVTGNVTWSANTGCGSTAVTWDPINLVATATCTTSAATHLPVGADTVTATYNGDSNHSGSTGTMTQNVTGGIATTIDVTSVSPASEDYGSTAPVTITALLSWVGNGVAPTASDVTIGGNGTGTYGATSCAPRVHETITCTAVFTPAGTDLPGTYTETATFSGDSNYGGSSSPETNNFTINQATTTTSVVGSPNPSTYATSVTFTATITGENGLARRNVKRRPLDVTGSVTWSANTGCTTTTVTGGVATCTTSAATHLPVGANTVTATYSGDANHTGSTGSMVQNVTGGIATTIDVTSVSPSAEDFGADTPVTITALLSWTGKGVAPTASNVTIGGNGNGTYGATSCAARVHETITCTATYTPNNSDVPGSYTETATFSGDSNYSGSTSPETNNFAINGASTSTSVVGNPNPSTYATSVTFTATITSDTGNVKGGAKKKGAKPLDIIGTVAWSANTGCSPSPVSGGYPGVATCTTSSATHLPVGADTVTATYSGDSNHSGSTGTMTQNVTGGIATSINVTSVSPAAEDYGQDAAATITAVLTWTGNGVAPTASDVTISGNGNGTYGATSCAPRVHESITCTATYTPSNADVVGSYNETAAFSGDSNYSGSTSPQTGNFTINAATSTTGVTAAPNPSTYGGSVTFTATINGENGAVKGNKTRKPLDVTGTVTWSANTGCSASTVSGYPGVATCTTSSLLGGTDTVTATYAGDSNHSGSTGSASQVVNPASQTITCGALPSSEPYNSSFTASCSASSGLPVTYASGGSCSNTGATYTMTSGTGSCLVTVTQGGNNDYSAATPFNGSVNATKANQTITVTTPAPATATNGSSFTIVASASSGLAITYSSGGACTNSGATYTIKAKVGTCTAQLTQGGNTNYNIASPVVDTTKVVKAVVPTVSLTGGPTKAPYEDVFTVTATSNETGPEASVPAITTLTPTVCSVSGYTASGTSASATVTMLTGAGTCTVEATWAANYVYAAATKKEPTTAQKVAPTVTFTGAPATEANGSNFTVTATSDEIGSYAVVPTIMTPGTVCTVGTVTSNGSGGYQATVTMVKATGTCTLNAKWAGSNGYAAASATQSTTATH
jgi:hypothetical protein